MTGSIQTKANKYYVVLNTKDENGKRKQKWVSTQIPATPDNRSLAELEKAKILRELENMQYSNAKTETLSKPENMQHPKPFGINIIARLKSGNLVALTTFDPECAGVTIAFQADSGDITNIATVESSYLDDYSKINVFTYENINSEYTKEYTIDIADIYKSLYERIIS